MCDLQIQKTRKGCLLQVNLVNGPPLTRENLWFLFMELGGFDVPGASLLIYFDEFSFLVGSTVLIRQYSSVFFGNSPSRFSLVIFLNSR